MKAPVRQKAEARKESPRRPVSLPPLKPWGRSEKGSLGKEMGFTERWWKALKSDNPEFGKLESVTEKERGIVLDRGRVWQKRKGEILRREGGSWGMSGKSKTTVVTLKNGLRPLKKKQRVQGGGGGPAGNRAVGWGQSRTEMRTKRWGRKKVVGKT